MKRQGKNLYGIALTCWVWAASLLWTVGCGLDRLSTVPAKGTVTLDGKPLADANITFTPDRGRSATGKSSADGTFVLSTYDQGDGAIVGHHLVTVTAREVGAADTPGAPGITRPGRSLIPERYGNTATSGLSFEVTDGPENVFEIQLTSKEN